ncbi:MFS transporter [Psychrobacter arenosus]|uniref:MFS transporter n=1 Tax=Psychrobacter arenosus TaxID=256326 RepID=UPI00191B849F|nr:MFS transporter [Psychrobacter arenosus]
MHAKELLEMERREIRALHYTWIAFFLTFYVWFNMAPLASSMLAAESYLTSEHIKLFLIANVALTIPGRVVVGMALDRFGPRRVFSVLMVVMAIPTWFFAFGNSATQLFVSRLFMSIVGAGFVVGIHMTTLWFKPKDIGFAEGFYAGWGNFGSAAAAITIPTVALQFFGGDDGWRWAIAASGLIMAIYGVAYWFLVTDGPTADTHKKSRKSGALEVSTWRDLWLYCLFIIPLYGILSVLVYRTQSMGFLSETGAWVCYGAIAVMVIYQIYKALSVNIPIIKAGIPEDDKYSFSSVAALNISYFANFGAELAVVSMLPMFFQGTWKLDATSAGLIASTFAFVNLWARPLGGYISDRVGSRRKVMLVYMFGIGLGFVAMGMLNESWPLFFAVCITIICSVFVQGAEGATFGVIPSIKRRLTGQISGMTGAYGNVGAVFYLFLFTFVEPNQFFYVIAAGAFIAWLVCYVWLQEPADAFGEEYTMSSVDRMLAEKQ